MIKQDLLDILACPLGKADLRLEGDKLVCTKCGTKFRIENDIPNVTEVGGRFLNMLIKMTQAKQVLEIGCANGYSTIWMAEAVRKNGGKVSTIDFSKPTFEAAKKNLAKAGLSDYVNFYFGNALVVILDIEEPEQFVFIFVDGEKKSYWAF